nr:FAD:protein FMN transferase [Chenggangzhangella methanolivorans]
MSGFSRRKLLAGGAGTLAAAAVGGAAFRELARAHGKQVATRAGVAFGTTVALTFRGPRRTGARGLNPRRLQRDPRARARREPDAARQRAVSPHRAGALDRPDPRLVALASYALALAERSGGAFDPTVQPLWTLWERTTRDGRRPDEAERARRSPGSAGATSRFPASGSRSAARRRDDAERDPSGLRRRSRDRGGAAPRRRRRLRRHRRVRRLRASPGWRPWRLGGRTAKEGGETDVLSSDFQGFAATSAGAGTPFSKDGADNHIFDPAPASRRNFSRASPSSRRAGSRRRAVDRDLCDGEGEGRGASRRAAGLRARPHVRFAAAWACPCGSRWRNRRTASSAAAEAASAGSGRSGSSAIRR